MKNFGNRVASIFERKKKETGQVVEEKQKNVEDTVEEQLTKAANILKETKKDTENVAKSTGNFFIVCSISHYYFVVQHIDMVIKHFSLYSQFCQNSNKLFYFSIVSATANISL